MAVSGLCREIFGDRHAYNLRASRMRSRWLPGSDVLDLLTAAQLAIVGEMPCVAHRGAVTPGVRELMRSADLPWPEEVLSYSSAEEQRHHLESLARQGFTIVLQHVLHETEVSESALWLAPAELSRLNNKANLADFVEPQYLPRRTCRERAFVDPRQVELPCLIKAATDESTGGGGDVFRCVSRADVERALGQLAGEPRLVIEELLEMKRNLCLNFAVSRDGEITYLGATEQIVGADCIQTGNWLGVEEPTEQAVALGRSIARRAHAVGYYGFAGFDVCDTREGELKAFDLNFRLNASTAPLVIYGSALAGTGTVAKLGLWRSRGGFDAGCRALRPFIGRRDVVPTAAFDGGSSLSSGFFLLSCGDSREDALEIESELRDAGLCSAA